MQFIKSVASFSQIAVLAILVSGCATSIPAEKQKDYSLLIPVENHSSIIDNIDGQESFLKLAGANENVLPGNHKIGITVCSGSGSSGHCIERYYSFESKAGLAYVFNGPYKIEVYDRFDKSKLLDTLVASGNGNNYIPADEARKNNAEMQKRQGESMALAQAEIMQRRKANLPLIRKIGTQICKENSGGIIFVGYVEALAEEKVQIRVSNAYLKVNHNARPGDFTPSIIWDSPMNWDLCE